jgi:hypothetical protein
MKKFIVFVSALASQLMLTDVFAQAPPPPGVPIDGGITIIIGAAIAYGVREKLKSKE